MLAGSGNGDCAAAGEHPAAPISTSVGPLLRAASLPRRRSSPVARSPLPRRCRPPGAPVVDGSGDLRPVFAPSNLALQRTRPRGAFRWRDGFLYVAGPLSFNVRRLSNGACAPARGIRRRRYPNRSVPCFGRRRCPVGDRHRWRGRRCPAIASHRARPSSLACGSCVPRSRRLTLRCSGPGHRARFGGAIICRRGRSAELRR